MTAELTVAELNLIDKLGECASAFAALLDGDRAPARTGSAEWHRLKQAHAGDLAEFVAHVHDLQHAVMARSTRRLHPVAFSVRLPRGGA